MSRYVLLGQAGSSELLMVDTQAKTVHAVDPDAVDTSLARAQADGETTIRGINVAIAVESQQQAVGRFFYPGAN